MLKQIIILLLASTFSINLYASNIPSNEIAIKLSKLKIIDELVLRENEILNLTKNYMYKTADFAPTTDKIVAYYGINISKFKNNLGTYFKIETDLTNQEFKIINSLNIAPSMSMYNSYIYNTNRDSNNYISENGTVTQRFETKTIEFINMYKQIENDGANSVVSSTEPTDTSKIWYKPDGNGGFSIYEYDINSKTWIPNGTMEYNTQDYIIAKPVIFKDGKFNQYSTPGVKGQMGYLEKDNGVLISYIYNGTSWVKKGATLSEEQRNTTLFSGFGNLEDILTIYDKENKSSLTAKVNVSDMINIETMTWTTNKYVEFVKYNNTNIEKEAWISNDKKLIIAKNLKAFETFDSIKGGWLVIIESNLMIPVVVVNNPTAYKAIPSLKLNQISSFGITLKLLGYTHYYSVESNTIKTL